MMRSHDRLSLPCQQPQGDQPNWPLASVSKEPKQSPSGPNLSVWPMATLSKEDRESLDLRSEVTQQWKTTVSTYQALHTEHLLTSSLSVWWGLQPPRRRLSRISVKAFPEPFSWAVKTHPSCSRLHQWAGFLRGINMTKQPEHGHSPLPGRDHRRNLSDSRALSTTMGSSLLYCEPKLALSTSTNFPSGLNQQRQG